MLLFKYTGKVANIFLIFKDGHTSARLVKWKRGNDPFSLHPVGLRKASRTRGENPTSDPISVWTLQQLSGERESLKKNHVESKCFTADNDTKETGLDCT